MKPHLMKYLIDGEEFWMCRGAGHFFSGRTAEEAYGKWAAWTVAP